MMFWNTSPNRDYLMKLASTNYGFCRHEVIGYQEMIEEERQNEDESKLKGTVQVYVRIYWVVFDRLNHRKHDCSYY